MQCKDCGAEVANIGQLNKHKKDCPGPKGAVIIPWSMVDENLAVLSPGDSVTAVFIGVIAKDGIQVQEIHPFRRGRRAG